MKNWEQKFLKDVTSYLNRGFPPLYTDNGILIINQKCIKDNRISFDEARYSSLKKKFPSEKELQLGDILVNSTGIGTLGRTAQVKVLKCRTSVDSHITIVRINERADKRFIGYQLAYNEPVLDLMGQGTTQQTELSRNDLGKLKILLPPLLTQNKIADILSSYDDLIENNIRRIELLDELAQLTFNKSFGDLLNLPGKWRETNLGSLIGHEIGGGWGEESNSYSYSEAAYVIRGTDINDIRYGKSIDVPFRYHKKSNLASRRLRDGDIVFEVSGGSSFEGVAKTLLITDELLRLFNNDVMCASFCKLLRPISRNLSYFIFLFLRFLREVKGTEVFEIRSASNIVNYNWSAFLKFQKVKVPDDKSLKDFNEIIDPIYKQIYSLGHQNRLLKEARDILLPRLMRGMIEV